MPQINFESELSRCLGCKVKPCQKACPLGVSPHDFIEAAKNGDYTEAAQKITSVNPLPQTCGLVCPDHFCQKACIRARIDTPIEIPCLQAHILQNAGLPPLELPDTNGKTIAVIGGGPAGLGAIYELIISGYKVCLFEQSSALGGAARLIPDYRLPKDVLDKEIARLTTNDRVEVRLNTKITDFKRIKEHYDGVILALGETTPRTLGVDGEECCIPYASYLKNPHKYIGKKVAVTGGGEVALDCALTAKKCGCDCVEMFVRRRKADMRIMKRDFLDLEQYNIIIRDLSSITEIYKNDNDLALNTIKNRINDQGKAEPCSGTECILGGYDLLIQALGATYPKENIPENYLIAGDMTGNGGTIVQALASGKAAAHRLIDGETI